MISPLLVKLLNLNCFLAWVNYFAFGIICCSVALGGKDLFLRLLRFPRTGHIAWGRGVLVPGIQCPGGSKKIVRKISRDSEVGGRSGSVLQLRNAGAEGHLQARTQGPH